MGQEESSTIKTGLCQKELNLLSTSTKFSAQEISLIYSRFSAKTQNKNAINKGEFQSLLKIASDEYADRLFYAIDTDKDKIIKFPELLSALSQLSNRSSITVKASFCFKLIDNKENGYFDKNDLLSFVNAALSLNQSIIINESSIDQIVKSTIVLMNIENDGNVTLKDFISYALKDPKILDFITFTTNDIFNDCY